MSTITLGNVINDIGPATIDNLHLDLTHHPDFITAVKTIKYLKSMIAMMEFEDNTQRYNKFVEQVRKEFHYLSKREQEIYILRNWKDTYSASKIYDYNCEQFLTRPEFY